MSRTGVLLMAALVAACGRSDGAGRLESAAKVYADYWTELDQLEGAPHTEEQSIRLRSAWIDELESAGLRAEPERQSHYYGLAARVAWNLYAYTEQESHAMRAHELAARACARLRHATSLDQVEAALDVRSESAWLFSEQPALLADLRRDLSAVRDRDVRSAVAEELGSLLCELGDMPGLVRLRSQEATVVLPWCRNALDACIVRLREPGVGDPLAPSMLGVSEDLDRAMGDLGGSWGVVLLSRPGCGACRAWLAAFRQLGEVARDVRLIHLELAVGEHHAPESGDLSQTVLCLDAAQVAKLRLGTRAVPRTFVVDPKGRVHAKDVGREQIESVLSGLPR